MFNAAIWRRAESRLAIFCGACASTAPAFLRFEFAESLSLDSLDAWARNSCQDTLGHFANSAFCSSAALCIYL